MKTMKPLPLAVLCSLLLASAGAQAVTCQNSLPPSNPDSIYTNNNDGTVTDTRTGLMWKQCVEGLSGADCADGSAASYNWAGALTHAESHEFAGYTDWRLPNLKELHSLVEECRTGPAINDTVFPATPSSNVWSGSPYASYSDGAWGVLFFNGYAYGSFRSSGDHVRLVRGGQSFDPLPENGACGTAHGQATLLAPADNLCSAGTASSVSTAVGAFTWSCDGVNGGTTASCSAPRQYTVTPSAGANGAISPDSAQNVTYNQTRSFTVTPNAGYTASIAGTCPAGSWSGNDYTTGQIVGDCTVAASFTQNAHAISTSVSAGSGTVSCTPNPVPHGGSATCTATPAAGFNFASWGGACSGSGGCTLSSVISAQSVSASFTAAPPPPPPPVITYNVTAASSPAVGGTAACTPSSVSSGGTSTCTATANAGYRFTGWSGDCSGTEVTCTLTGITADRSVTAGFAAETWTIGTQAEPAAGGSVVCDPSSVAHGGASTCTATANTGYRFTGWSGDCTGTEASCTLADITADRSVTASFVAETWTIGTQAEPAAGGSVTCDPSSVAHGGASTCTATANAGYRFTGWSGDCTGTDVTCTLTDITADLSVTASFASRTELDLPLPEGLQSGQTLHVVATGGEWYFDEAHTRTHTGASVGEALPAGVTLPHGVVSLRLIGGTPGSSATVVLTYPEALPAGTRYYKYGPTAANPAAHWYEYPHAVIDGNTITLTLTDGGLGDSDLSENGVIVDPGGPAQVTGDVAPDVTPIPTLSQWATLLLAGFMGLLA
ncbi:MAG: IPTL-CTERM sorting domain-containing protein, partial [Rhodocyclaceae bacterium]